jgi:hypothetical protein
MGLSIKNGYYGTTDAVQLTDRRKVLTRLKVFPTSQNQNFVLFPNMDLEILCRILFESSELIFDRPKKFVSGGKFFHTILYFHFCNPKLQVGTFAVIPACRTKCTIWVLSVFRQDFWIFVFPKSWFLKNRLFHRKAFHVATAFG